MAVVRVRYEKKRYGSGHVVVDREGFGWAWYAAPKCRLLAPTKMWCRWALNELAGWEVWRDGGVRGRR